MTFVKVNNPVTRSFDGLINELFNEIPSHLTKAMREDVLNFPPVNIIEKSGHYNLQMQAPGMEKADFSINLDGQLLTITAEKKEEKKGEETDKLIRREFSQKAFKRSFTLDEKIDAENISATYENGLLTVELPKKEEQKKSSTDIKVK